MEILPPQILKASESDVGKRVDKFLSQCLADISRTQIKKSFDHKLVYVNCSVVLPKYTLMDGDVIEFRLLRPDEIKLKPYKAALDILFEDDDIIVLNKPAGVVVYPGNGQQSPTFVEMVLSHCKLSKLSGSLRPGIVHRLDKDTSGILILAKGDAAYLRLVKMFSNREVEKFYRTIVYGKFDKSFGEICEPIGRSNIDRTKMSVRKGGKQAITRWELLQTFKKKFSYLNVQILTGRTHQIRVHMSYIGHPIAGDIVYGYNKNLSCGLQFPRVMLHAYKIKLKHPISDESLEITAPLPNDFKESLEKLEAF